VLCLAAAVFAALAGSALAAQTHPYTGTSFGPDGVGGSASFEAVRSIAVDPANGDTFVYDAGAGKVYKFNSAGAPVNFSATGTNAINGVGGGAGGAEYEIALAPAGSPAGTAGDIYVANNGGAIHVYSAAGAELGELGQGGETCGVATDPSGNFYAGVYGSTINKYTPSANPPLVTDKSATGTAEVGLCNVAADGLGNIYAANYGGNGLYKLEGIGDTSPTLIDSGANTMAVAPGSNDLYADYGNEVFQYDSSGTPIGSFASGDISESHGVAVNAGASKIYVGTTTKVKVFGPSTTVPDAVTEAADAVTKTTAMLHGRVGAAGGPDATCVFQYVTENVFFEHGFEGASEKPCNPAGPFSGAGTTPVSATATGLSAETNYRFRLLATSSNGSNGSPAFSFSTPGAVNVLTDPATNVTPSSATLNGTINPEGTELEECFFEYRRREFGTPYSSVPCAESPAAIGSGNAPVSVHLDLTELLGGSTYQFRLVGGSEFGNSQGALEEFTTPGPSVIAESIDEVSETSATFHATINPNGVSTSFLFAYVTQAEFELNGFANAAKTPVVGESIGAGIDNVEVSAQAGGLTPKEAYRFRVVATNTGGITSGSAVSFTTPGPSVVSGSCPNDPFRTGFGAALPDCRAYEQASPVDKGGQNVEGFKPFFAAAPDGSRVSFFSQGGSGIPVPGGAHQEFSALLSSRNTESWSTQRLLPPEDLGERAGFIGASDNLRYALVEAAQRGNGSTHNGLYLIDTMEASLTPVVPYLSDGNENEGAFAEEYGYDGISVDGSRVFFEARLQLTGNAAGEEHQNLYMWHRASGEVSLVGVLPGGSEEAPAGGSFGGAYSWFGEGGTGSGGSLAGLYVEALHAISPDGDQAYFTAGETGQLYLRRGLTGSAPSTVRVSAPESGVTDSNGPQPAAFQEATPDGTRAFFLSSEKLTANATTGESDGGKDLYRYNAESGTVVDVVPNLASPNGAEVRGLLGASTDGSSGYLVARGVLASGGTLGANNIYHFVEQGGTFILTFVARLDDSSEANDTLNWSPQGGQNTEGSTAKMSRVTPDGQTLVFSSTRSLTGYDNKPCGRGGTCVEVYVYSAGSQSLHCISCNPTGEAPNGDAELSTATLNAHLIPISHVRGTISRNVSPDGSRVFFQTPDPLVASDTNEETGCAPRQINYRTIRDCSDVYEWEAPGAPGGSCQAPEVNGGCLYLLSTGKSTSPSFFIDASVDGTSAFIATTSQLVPADRDELYDLYDARTDGGLAAQHALPPAPCASGEACHGPALAAPEMPSPDSSSFQGPGNSKRQAGRKTRCHRNAHGRHCAKKHRKKRHGGKSAKRPSAITKKAGGSK
jgi:hypothetical protein